MKTRTKKGFTLMEMLIVIAIIAILIAIAIPTFSGQLEKAREATDLANVRSAYAVMQTCVLANEGPNGEAVADIGGYNGSDAGDGIPKPNYDYSQYFYMTKDGSFKTKNNVQKKDLYTLKTNLEKPDFITDTASRWEDYSSIKGYFIAIEITHNKQEILNAEILPFPFLL